jgi:hypothetical protein
MYLKLFMGCNWICDIIFDKLPIMKNSFFGGSDEIPFILIDNEKLWICSFMWMDRKPLWVLWFSNTFLKYLMSIYT